MLMPARRRRMRSMAKPKSPTASSGTTGPPKRSRASRASCQEREARITTMWDRSWGSGLVQESGWTLSRSLRLYSSFGSTGKVWTFWAGSVMALLRGLGVRRVDLLAQRLAGQAGDEGGDDDRGQQSDSQHDPELRPLLRLGSARQGREAAQRL